MSELKWSIDSLVVKDGLLFGYGWAFHPEQEIFEVRFKLNFTVQVESEYIPAETGKLREDVASFFSDQPNAGSSGFLVYGAFVSGKRPGSIEMECELMDRSVVVLIIPSSSVSSLPSGNEGASAHMARRYLSSHFRKALQLVRQGKISVLYEKIARIYKSLPRTTLQKPSDLASTLKSGERRSILLMIDHDLGGGANHYRERLVDSVIREGRTVLVLSYHLATLSHILIVRNERINMRYAIPSRDFFMETINFLKVKDIVYNTAVSLAWPLEIPRLLTDIKKSSQARLEVLVHDFYLACPSHFLLNGEGRFCNIPDSAVCADCLPENKQGFVSIFVRPDIVKWRESWGRLVYTADSIVTFSKNSADILRKAYPKIDAARISITPHRVEYLKNQIPNIKNTTELRIGVVGHIGFHKGSILIRALAQEIKKRRMGVKIVVIGTIDTVCDRDVLSQTGEYKHEQLSSLIEASGVNVMLFPSICPETFSFVVQELTDMELPVASFSLGAPAERLASYSKGLVLASMDPNAFLDELIDFHRKIYFPK